MSKLITAAEAVALSKRNESIDKHIDHINYQVRRACKNGFCAITIEIEESDIRNLVSIAARLRAAGYCFKWRRGFDDKAWLDLSWGGH